MDILREKKYPNQCRVIEQAKFTYSLYRKAF